MSSRREQREQLGLSQAEAARLAGVSGVTWRKWEEAPEKVSAATRASCERLFEGKAAYNAKVAAEAADFAQAWGDCPSLTPRQAWAIAGELEFWADTNLAEWLREPAHEPLHNVSPFEQVDLRVMILVDENRAWAAAAQKRCRAVANEMRAGVLPFDRPGCFFDELLMALALPRAQPSMVDMPELFDVLPARTETGPDEEGWVADSDWDLVSDAFDDRCRWDEWEVPVMKDHPLLAAILAARHPSTWFDVGQPTGPGYLARLAAAVAAGTD